MVRVYLGLAVVAILVLTVLWRAPGPSAKLARWIATAYLIAAAVLLALGIGM